MKLREFFLFMALQAILSAIAYMILGFPGAAPASAVVASTLAFRMNKELFPKVLTLITYAAVGLLTMIAISKIGISR